MKSSVRSIGITAKVSPGVPGTSQLTDLVQFYIMRRGGRGLPAHEVYFFPSLLRRARNGITGPQTVYCNPTILKNIYVIIPGYRQKEELVLHFQLNQLGMA